MARPTPQQLHKQFVDLRAEDRAAQQRRERAVLTITGSEYPSYEELRLAHEGAEGLVALGLFDRIADAVYEVSPRGRAISDAELARALPSN